MISPADDCDSILQQYSSGLAATLDKHAPVIKIKFPIRPDNPWDSEEIHTARRNVRRLERRWKVTMLSIDKDLMKSALCNLRAMIHKAKFNFLNSQIVENRENKSLSRLIDSLLLVKPGLKRPQHQSLIELVESFGQFFVSKIDTIRSALDAVDLAW